MLLVVSCVVCAVCCALAGVGWLLYVVWCLSFVVCGMVFSACVVCCVLAVVW